MKVVVTGATGFVGRALVIALLKQGHQVIALVRHVNSSLPDAVQQIETGDLHYFLTRDQQNLSQLTEAISGAECLVHLAARVHVMHDADEKAADLYHKQNVVVTERLAQLAAASDVGRFILLSSIKVNGESTLPGQPFTENSAAAPQDAYGQSKWQAEQVLTAMAAQHNMAYVIIRPPLIYGPGVRANFQQLIGLVQKMPVLPFGAVKNQRSMLALDNLVAFIMLVMHAKPAANQTYLIADGSAISTKTLTNNIAWAYQAHTMQIPVPVALMRFMAGMLGKSSLADRLFDSLAIDVNKAQRQLGWQPVCSMQEQLSKMYHEDLRH